MEYIRAAKAAEKWGISARRVRILCAEGKIPGVVRKGNLYMIPADAQKPLDGRRTRAGILAEIEQKKARLNEMRPLTPGEVRRLQEEFMVEFTYNSNAIVPSHVPRCVNIPPPYTCSLTVSGFTSVVVDDSDCFSQPPKYSLGRLIVSF